MLNLIGSSVSRLVPSQRFGHCFHYGSLAAKPKLAASDVARKSTTDAAQIFGSNGFTKDYPVERSMCEAKVLRIVECTRENRRVVISCALSKHVG